VYGQFRFKLLDSDNKGSTDPFESTICGKNIFKLLFDIWLDKVFLVAQKTQGMSTKAFFVVLKKRFIKKCT
jgi:hypothetical protein